MSLVALFYASIAIFVVVILGAIMKIAGLNIFKFLAYLRERSDAVAAGHGIGHGAEHAERAFGRSAPSP